MRIRKILCATILLISLPTVTMAMVTTDDYERAESFLPWNLQKLAKNVNPDVTWLENGNGLWVREQIGDGYKYQYHTENTVQSAFDHKKITASLNEVSNVTFDANALDFSNLKITGDNEQFSFHTRRGNHYSQYRCSVVDSECSVTHIDGVISPDGNWTATVREDRNIYLINLKTNEEHQLTHNATKEYIYGTWMPAADIMVAAGKEDVLRAPEIHWSPDSKKFLSYALDLSKAKTLTLVQAVHDEGIRPKSYTYPYSLPGDTDLTMMENIVFHVDGKRVDAEASKIPMRYDDDGPLYQWSKDSSSVSYIEYGRGNSEAWIKEINAEDGNTRIVFTKNTDDGFIYPSASRYKFFNGGNEFVLMSERDGWNHLYRHDSKTGAIKNQVTKGEFVVQEIVAIDEENEQLYFTANGREAHLEPDSDPYYRYFYRVGLDGNNLTLITKDRGDHEITLSPDFKMVVDKYSTPLMPTKTILRSTDDGAEIKVLVEADISELIKVGWKYPETFMALAEDGKTPIYGMIYYPSNFDPNNSYPVVENIYASPGMHNVKKSFRRTYVDSGQAIAELGFIVVKMDSRGSGLRNTNFHFAARGNLGGYYGDRVAAIKQLAQKYSFIDDSRVGIYGMSAGGYASTRAILLYPDFYKVAVSSSGNHDHRLDKADWNEKWMGFPVGQQYIDNSNLEIAHRLKGKMLLAVGELDHNVPPAATLQLVDRLIKANKDFDFLMMPNRQHSLERDNYYIRKRWDYFVEHLLGDNPPQYEIN